jgi:hypothetical protein
LQAILEGFDRIAHVFYFTTMSFILQGCAPWFPIAARADLRQQDSEARGLAPGTRGGNPREFRGFRRCFGNSKKYVPN